MNELYKKIVCVVIIVFAAICLWNFFGRSGNLSDYGEATYTVGRDIQSTQREAESARDSIGSAEKSVDESKRTTESISDSNRKLEEINRENAGLIDSGERILEEIRRGKQEDEG